MDEAVLEQGRKKFVKLVKGNSSFAQQKPGFPVGHAFEIGNTDALDQFYTFYVHLMEGTSVRDHELVGYASCQLSLASRHVLVHCGNDSISLIGELYKLAGQVFKEQKQLEMTK